MAKNTPNKRKSSSISNATPNKTPKISDDTPVSKKINQKSPKSANKINLNKTPKSPSKNKKNDQQLTPKGRKKTKQIEKIESDDESDQLYGNNDNSHDESDEEVDSNEGQVDEANSNDKVEMEEEANDSDWEVDLNEEQVDEADSDEEAEIAKEDDSDEKHDDVDKTKNKDKDSHCPTFNAKKRTDLTLIVKGLKPNDNILHIFRDCAVDKIEKFRNPKLPKNTSARMVRITFKDKESVKKAMEKNGIASDGFILTVGPDYKENVDTRKFTALVKNLNSNIKLENVFKNCKIQNYSILRDHKTNKSRGMAFVNFEDEESLQKALLKNKTEYDGHVITVLRSHCGVVVKNLNKDSKVEDLFEDLKIQCIDVIENTTVVNFKDEESFKIALSKDKTKFEDRTIRVQVYGSHHKQNSATTRNYSKPIRNSFDSGSKDAIMKKKLLLKLKAQAQQLEREINEHPKSLHKKKH